MYKIAFIGSHGVGKTTLAYGLAARLKRRDFDLEVVVEVARRCPLPLNEETTVEAQSWIWCELGLAEEESRNPKGALEGMRIAIEQFRYYPPPFYYVAKYLKFRGEEAKEHCKIYLAIAPRGEFAPICRKKFKLE